MITLLQHQIKIAWNKALKQVVFKNKIPLVFLAEKGKHEEQARSLCDDKSGGG